MAEKKGEERQKPSSGETSRSGIWSKPTTVEDCKSDYKKAAAERASFDRHAKKWGR